VNNRLPRIAGFALACSSAMLLPLAASADDSGGWYAGGELGVILSSSQNLSSNNGVTLTNNYNSGFGGSILGGYGFANGWRPELEFSYRGANVGTIQQSNGIESTNQTNNISGTMSLETLMVNGWWDFKQSDGFFATVHPYVGGGVGGAHFNLNGESFNTTGNSGTYSHGPLADGSSTGFAYQFGFGAGIGLTPALWASLDFRYLGTSSVSVSNEQTGGKFGGTYHSPSLLVGLKYRFGAAEAE
jgi:hypothetical protein